MSKTNFDDVESIRFSTDFNVKNEFFNKFLRKTNFDVKTIRFSINFNLKNDQFRIKNPPKDQCFVSNNF